MVTNTETGYHTCSTDQLRAAAVSRDKMVRSRLVILTEQISAGSPSAHTWADSIDHSWFIKCHQRSTDTRTVILWQQLPYPFIGGFFLLSGEYIYIYVYIPSCFGVRGNRIKAATFVFARFRNCEHCLTERRFRDRSSRLLVLELLVRREGNVSHCGNFILFSPLRDKSTKQLSS